MCICERTLQWILKIKLLKALNGWISVILDGGYWQAFVNRVINSRVPKIRV